MKKTIPFLIILLALTALTFGSECILNRIFTDLETTLNTTEQYLLADDFETALSTATACLEAYHTHAKTLVYFIPNETLTLFETSIYGMVCYITEQNRTEALAEASRAHAQLNAIWTLYFRAI